MTTVIDLELRRKARKIMLRYMSIVCSSYNVYMIHS